MDGGSLNARSAGGGQVNTADRHAVGVVSLSIGRGSWRKPTELPHNLLPVASTCKLQCFSEWSFVLEGVGVNGSLKMTENHSFAKVKGSVLRWCGPQRL